jgi:hypothetical protein
MRRRRFGNFRRTDKRLCAYLRPVKNFRKEFRLLRKAKTNLLHAAASAPSFCFGVRDTVNKIRNSTATPQASFETVINRTSCTSPVMALSLTMYDTLLAFLPLIGAYLIYRSLTSPNVSYPPGPRPYPFIGNLPDVPTSYQERAFADLAKIYGMSSFRHSLAKLIGLGNVVHLRIFTKNLVILSSFEDAQELLEKRSAIYSSRSRFVLHAEM